MNGSNLFKLYLVILLTGRPHQPGIAQNPHGLTKRIKPSVESSSSTGGSSPHIITIGCALKAGVASCSKISKLIRLRHIYNFCRQKLDLILHAYELNMLVVIMSLVFVPIF